MRRVLQIAAREFLVIVTSKAFLIGLLFLPVMIGLVALAMNAFGEREFVTRGEVAVIDRTGVVTERMQAVLTEGNEYSEMATLARVAAAETSGNGDLRAALTAPPDVTLVELPATADVEAEKSWLLDVPPEARRLALIVVYAGAVAPVPDEAGEDVYDMYVPQGSDTRSQIAVHAIVREAIRSLRIDALGVERRLVDAAANIPRVSAVTVMADGEQTAAGGLNIVLPAAFMFLLFMGVMGGGQGLLHSTIEEKSSRVVEVLLSAVSPMQFMAGKLLGHMSVSLVGMSIYLAAGLLLMTSVSMLGLLEPILILYLFVFFIVAFFTMGSLMMAVGSAVNEISEANSLMTPFMFVLMLPWFLWFPVSRDPNSMLSVAISFIPPINSFGMMMRLASTEPPPAWQVWLSVAVGVATVYVSVWIAAKVFRIGLLMHGKPPNFKTLLSWVRQA